MGTSGPQTLDEERRREPALHGNLAALVAWGVTVHHRQVLLEPAEHAGECSGSLERNVLDQEVGAAHQWRVRSQRRLVVAVEPQLARCHPVLLHGA